MTPDDDKSLGDGATFSGQVKQSRSDMSLGDEPTTSGGDAAGLDTVLEDIEIVDLDARYKIEGPLGKGGMGAVVLATDTRLGRKVAIKQIRGESARSKSAIARFLTEARAIAVISHPNVVQIHDYGQAKDGPFLVIEYIDGGSLLDRCKSGSIPLEEAVEIFVQLCQGLGRAHDLGVVHRDIKPANILLTKDGIAKLTDFGLAKSQSGNQDQTIAGAVMGTPDFMPPEQRQDAALVDHRSDLWSLAAAFYQAVSGRSPKVIRLHELPQALQPIMSKALEDDKDARYQSAKEFRDALKSILQAGSAKPAVFEGELQEGQCKACGTVNLDLSRKFCKKCVASLRVPCLACDVQIPVWDKICGECGGNQPVLFEAMHTQISGQKASAEALAADLAFDKAIGIAEEITKETHPELAVFVSWSKSFIESTIAERNRQQALAAERLKDGQTHFAAFDYSAAIQAIEAIPESLRVDKASKLLTDCRSLEDESVRLVEKIKIRINRKEIEGLLPLVSRAVELGGNRQDLLKIRQQLEERRDKKLSLAQAAMKAGDARTAAATLAGVAVEDLGTVGGDLLKRVQRAAALEVLLAEGIKSSKADSVVTNDEARGLLVLCDEYLLLNPQGVKVQAIREQLLKRQEEITAEIAAQLNQAENLEKVCRFDEAAILLQAIPVARRSAEVCKWLKRLEFLGPLRQTAMTALTDAEAGSYKRMIKTCQEYRAALLDAEIADTEFSAALSQTETEYGQKLRYRWLLLFIGVMAVVIVLAVAKLLIPLAQDHLQHSKLPAPQVAVETRPVMEKPGPVPKVFKLGETITNSIGMELIGIPAGTFTMGEDAGVAVTLTKPFGLGKTEVTQGQWQTVMSTEPWKGKDFVKADKDCPATYVSWDDATEFCKNLTDLERKSGKLKADEEYRLPTVAEWEYACRAGTTTAFSFGDDESKLGEYAWFNGNTGSEQYAHKVGLKKPNPWGLHDMHGNVWEWCSDWYGEELAGGTDPAGPNEGSLRVYRGGSWGSIPGYCRSAFRDYYVPSNRNDYVGFRVARSQSETVTGAERRQQGTQAKSAPQVAVVTKTPVENKSVTNSIGMELIGIPAGTFTMGSPKSEKNHQADQAQVSVTLTKPFELGKYEVTQGQWKSVMGTEPWYGEDYVQADKDCPATYVGWDDATEFCEKLTAIERKAGILKADEEYRLPTEAEWEYACRAGTTTAFSFGDDESKLGEYAWFIGNTGSEQYAHKVGTKKPNPWGLHDMHGNVFEWCSDWYDRKLSGGVDPVGPNGGSYRVFRGGCWWYSAGFCRSVHRYYNVPSDRDSILGFRVARSQSVTVTGAERRQQGAQAKPAPQVAVETKTPVENKSVTNSIGMELIGIPAGTFTMGSVGLQITAKVRDVSDVACVAVTLTKPFELGKYEVTLGQWKSVMGTEPWKGKDFIQSDKDCPATFVSWDDATEFCKKLTDLERKSGKLKADEEYRLPTEAEWEYACRAGTETAYSFGDDESKLGEYAWFNGNTIGVGEQYAHKVGMKKPNPWGLHDMHGNVWEWCSDWYGEELAGGTDPAGPNGGSGRVDRGGGCGNSLGRCRSASRNEFGPLLRYSILGFRVARSQSVQ